MRHAFTFLGLCLLLGWGPAWGQPVLRWDFPINRPHAGLLLGNGTQGLMVWGEGNELIITVGRAGFWDHRGGNDFATRITYDELEALLMAGDETALRAAFAVPERAGAPNLGRPQQIGGGRLVLTLPEGWTLVEGAADLATGVLQVEAAKGGARETLYIRQHPEQELAMLSLPPAWTGTAVRVVPSWDFVQDQLAPVGVQPPRRWETGFVQTLPEDLPLALAYRQVGTEVFFASAVHAEAEAQVRALLAQASVETLAAAAGRWWQAFWADAPSVSLPEPVLEEIFYYGLYKMACATPPQGVACTLQGPFMEAYQLPPWSNDYHLNINLEMIYYPVLMSGKFDHLNPLWDMLRSWWPEIQHNGRQFFQHEAAIMLPHAVDDRCKVVGTFWTGTIDHACTAWMAQLAWLHYRYAGDETILREIAFPLLQGAFEGYYAMLEREGDAYYLPVSVSPEYRGANMDAWGKNASFQLAALHATCEMLPQAAQVLGEKVDARWAEVAAHLPPYTTIEGVYQQEWQVRNTRIALWEGMDLVESHRHHSHLGSLYPFVTIDPQDPAHAPIVQTSLATWVYRGAGGWSGWCVPWASILMSRTNQAEAAVNWLKYWRDNFVNEGRGTLHNANTRGVSMIGGPVYAKVEDPAQRNEIMQLDAGFGALTAVYELLVQNRRDGIHVLPGLHAQWKALAFADVWTEGGFKVSARVAGSEVVEVKVEATRAGRLRIFPQLGAGWTLNGQPQAEAFWEGDCQAGEVLMMRRRP